jgi:hypothetical protein
VEIEEEFPQKIRVVHGIHHRRVDDGDPLGGRGLHHEIHELALGLLSEVCPDHHDADVNLLQLEQP